MTVTLTQAELDKLNRDAKATLSAAKAAAGQDPFEVLGALVDAISVLAGENRDRRRELLIAATRALTAMAALDRVLEQFAPPDPHKPGCPRATSTSSPPKGTEN